MSYVSMCVMGMHMLMLAMERNRPPLLSRFACTDVLHMHAYDKYTDHDPKMELSLHITRDRIESLRWNSNGTDHT